MGAAAAAMAVAGGAVATVAAVGAVGAGVMAVEAGAVVGAGGATAAGAVRGGQTSIDLIGCWPNRIQSDPSPFAHIHPGGYGGGGGGPPPAEEFVQYRAVDWVAPERQAEKSLVERLQVCDWGCGLCCSGCVGVAA